MEKIEIFKKINTEKIEFWSINEYDHLIIEYTLAYAITKNFPDNYCRDIEIKNLSLK